MTDLDIAIELSVKAARTQALIDAEKAVLDQMRSALDVGSSGTAEVLSGAATAIRELA